MLFAVGAYAFGASLRGSEVIVNEIALVRGAPGATAVAIWARVSESRYFRASARIDSKDSGSSGGSTGSCALIAPGWLRDRTDVGVVELERMHKTFLKMNRSGVVFVAALNGSTLGLGAEFAWANDLRVMADGDFFIGQPEVLLGIMPGGGGTQRLARLVGPAKAKDLIEKEFSFKIPDAEQKALGDILGPLQGDNQFDNIVRFMSARSS